MDNRHRSARSSVKKKILLIEDESFIREMMEEFLDTLDYSFHSAESPKQAERIAHSHAGEIGVVICDVVLGSSLGPEVVSRLRKWIPDMAVIYTSGYSTQEFQSAQHQMEGADFLPKPFSLDELKIRLDKAYSRFGTTG